MYKPKHIFDFTWVRTTQEEYERARAGMPPENFNNTYSSNNSGFFKKVFMTPEEMQVALLDRIAGKVDSIYMVVVIGFVLAIAAALFNL